MKKVIFYGAGEFGKQISGYLNYKGYDGLCCFADWNVGNIGDVNGYSVKSPEECVAMKLPFVVLIRDENVRKSVEVFLKEQGCDVYPDITSWVKDSGKESIEWHRDYVAYVHIDDMQGYYKNAENDNNIAIFWDEDSPFYALFKRLDLENVVELACGHGRHVPKYIEHAGNLILVDVLGENMDYCKKRFSLYSNIRYYCNSGRDLSEISNESCSSIFSYDAMVHFEMMDVWSYLQEMYRILIKGGRALIHHSNRSDAPLDEAFENSAHSRSFMSKNLFAYLSHRAGFTILEQKIINWGGIEGLDCISLIQKI